MSLTETIDTEHEFGAQWPRHAEAVFDGDTGRSVLPVLKGVSGG